MATFTLFGGAEIEMQFSNEAVITIFGGTDLFYPTVTQAILLESDPGEHAESRSERGLVFTLFGGVSINRPLIGREYMDLKRLLGAGGIARDDFRLLWMRHASRPLHEAYRSVTIFGSCDIVAPKKRHETAELERLQRTGEIDAPEFEALSDLVGHDRQVALSALPDLATRHLSPA